MTMGIMGLLLNVLIVVLLTITIGYCWILNKRIKILQDGKSELANLLQYFDESTVRASESIVTLQSASKKIGETMQSRIDKANYVMDDLNFIVDKGTRLVDQLEANFAVSRARDRIVLDDAIKNKMNDDMETVSDGEMLDNKEDTPVASDRKMQKIDGISTKDKTVASLEAVLNRVASRKKSVKTAANRKPAEAGRSSRSKAGKASRSKAEKELLDMIRAGIKG